MAFEEWWPSVGQVIGRTAAKLAWDHQQQRLDALEAKCENLLLEAQIHHGEDNTHKSIVLEIYQALGIQKGDWNGARPVLERIEALEAALQKVLDDSEVGVVPRSHLDHIERLLRPHYAEALETTALEVVAHRGDCCEFNPWLDDAIGRLKSVLLSRPQQGGEG